MHEEWWKLVSLAADPSSLPNLPIEICERILDECDVLVQNLPQARARTFGACCLTCRSWLPRSRYHLYKLVIVRSKEQVKQVSKLLHSIPALRTRVEKLIVYGSGNRKTDASWIGLVAFHLGSKLKALEEISLNGVNFSLMRLEAYTFWGAFNRAWRTDATRKLNIWDCTLTHLNQPIRLASVTKARSLNLGSVDLGVQAYSTPPVPVLPAGISLPLSELDVDVSTSNFVLPIPWHTLAKQCPSLSFVDIRCRNDILDLSSPDCQRFLVSILRMFRHMQRHNNANYVRFFSASLPKIEMRTRPCGESADADSTSLATEPRLHRALVLGDLWGPRTSIETLVQVLTWLEDAMALTNFNNGRFHHIEILDTHRPDSFQSLDDVLSRLSIATLDVHVLIKGGFSQPRRGCILLQAREHFPMLTSVVPNAFCDPGAGHPCESHPKQASGVEKRRRRRRG